MISKEQCCAFTGHRPEKLKMDEKTAKKLLCNGIESAINDGYTAFITGLAPGADIWAGEIVSEFKNIYPHIKLICALPFPSFAKNSPLLVSKADFVHTVSPRYTLSSFQARNKWMVDHASLLIALYSGEPGGTRNTLAYAKKTNVTIKHLTDLPHFKQLSF